MTKSNVADVETKSVDLTAATRSLITGLLAKRRREGMNDPEAVDSVVDELASIAKEVSDSLHTPSIDAIGYAVRLGVSLGIELGREAIERIP